MQIVNQIGYLQHWGMSPAFNVLSRWKRELKQSQQCDLVYPIRILISGCCDIRHIMKTLCDINAQNRKIANIEFYFHETKIELICRMLLLVHILHEQNLNFQERTELFLDLYGNAMIKERNARYLHLLKQDLLNFIHSETKVKTVLKKIVNLKHLKFEERDSMSEFIQSWSMKVDFDMEKTRDQRLRSLFKERYDYRSNLIDWDYNMLLLPCVPIAHFYFYREWRLTGLAFEQRFSTYCQPNRTLASYIPGTRKDTRTSCLVRGYWGDIIMSPYVAIGSRCDYPQKDLLFKKANYKNIGHNVELSIYNMMYWLHRLEEDKEYVKVFKDYYRADEETKKELEKKDKEKKAKKAEKKDNLLPIKEDEEEERPEDELMQEAEGKPQKLKLKPNKADQLDSDEERQKEEVDKINSKQIELAQGEQPILKGFYRYQTQIFPMAMSHQNLIKPKFHQFFDVVVLGFGHTAYITKQKSVLPILKKEGQLLVERSTFLIPKKPDERKQIDAKLQTLASEYKELEKIADTEEYFIYEKK